MTEGFPLKISVITVALAFVAAAASARAQETPERRRDELPAGRFLAVPRIAVSADDPDLTAPLAGYSWKNFFLRDRHSWFVLVPKGRINVDWYNFLNRPPAAPGIVPNSTADAARASLRNQVFIRRARLGLAGTFARGIDFRVEADFASVAQAGQYATLADASVVINYWDYLKLEVGQFYSPFTLENQTSENFTDFMEKSAVVRWAVPNTRDTGGMLFGEGPGHVVRWWFGLFDGSGQNFKNFDNRLAVQMRAIVAPLALWRKHPAWAEEVWLGGSFWWRQYDNDALAQTPSTTGAAALDLPSLTTTGGFSAFSSNYANGADANKNPIRSHLAPAGPTWKWALEVNVPVRGRYGVRAEYVHQAIDLHQYEDVNPSPSAGAGAGTGNPTRTDGPFAHLDGWGAYVAAWAWIGGDINADHPGLYSVPHWTGYVTPKPPRWAVLLAAKYEHVEFDITNLPMVGSKPDPATGHYGLDTFALGASIWVTRHSRLMVNYLANYIGLGDPARAAANATKNLFFQQFEHELLFRLQVNL
jgi:Phosphate-selective porin O and P